MFPAVILLGSNLGDRLQILTKARGLIGLKAGRILKTSLIYETEPWGYSDNKLFLNQVIIIECDLSPNLLLTELLHIEDALGRIRLNTGQRHKPSARLIDIDILFYGNKVINEPGLEIPHPLLQERKFALIPLNEIASDFKHPVLGKFVYELLRDCQDNLDVKLFQS